MGSEHRCRVCGCRLSRYNTGDVCGPCTRKATTDAETVPLTIPAQLWSEQEVRAALSALDFGLLSRLLRRKADLRQEDIATLTGLSQGYISQLESGARRLSNIDKALDFLTALGAPPDLIRPAAGQPENQKPHGGEYPDESRAPDPCDPHMMAAAAAEESLAFAESVTPSNVDEDTLEYLSFEISRIATEYVHAPLLPLLGDMIRLRDRLFRLVKGQQRPQQTRELFMLTGAACLLLAHASQNLGDSRSAMAQVRTAWACAEQADHTGLRAWTRGTAALITEWSPQNRMALRLAEHGAALAPAGESRIRVAAIEARTAARTGDRERAFEAIARLHRAREEEPGRDDLQQFGGLLTFPTAKQEYYLGAAYALLGDYEKAEQHSAAAIRVYASGPAEQRSYGDETLALVDIMTARLAQGDIAAASQQLQRIISLPPELRIQQLGTAMERVHVQLRHAANAGSREARELSDLVQGFRGIESGRQLPSL